MGKRGGSHADRNGPKKALAGKRVQIDRLIEGHKHSSLPKLNVPSHVRSACSLPQQPCPQKARFRSRKRQSTRQEPKQIIPGIPGIEDQEFLILDRRSNENSDLPLIRLPCEPSVRRSMRFQAQGAFPFLKLPGELRNKVYDYVINEECYNIEWLHHTQKSKTLTYELPQRSRALWPRLPPDTAQRRRSLDFHHRRLAKKHLSEEDVRRGHAMLLLVCRQISVEAASVLYSKSRFQFHGLGTLRCFLNNLRPASMASIQALSIKYRAYGNPAKIEHERFKEKHDRLWEKLCWRVADKCSLKSLALDLTLNSSPLIFSRFDEADVTDPGAHWIRPLWAFQDLDIEKCVGRIRCNSQLDTVLEVESWNMRKEILGDSWDEEAEKRKDAFGYEKSKRIKDGFKKGMILTVGPDGFVQST